MNCPNCGKPVRVVVIETRREEYDTDDYGETGLWKEPVQSEYKVDNYFAVCGCPVCPYAVEYWDGEGEGVYRLRNEKTQ